ncbi:HPr kinase/phosphorylase [Lutimaribacter marinistellae]|uniref:HPr kinase/phosphorylase n=1 Tax=Lutimaribacter marinistellae TaxID=1820329 RepID=A0ABV7TE46_9RHOB
MTDGAPETLLHGSSVAIAEQGLLVLGGSGSGKSGLCLRLIALGAELISDDRVRVIRGDDGIWLSRPAGLPPLVEARGIGLLKSHPVGPVRASWVVDMDRVETERLPRYRTKCILGHEVPLLRRVDAPHFEASLIQILKAGRQHPEGTPE